MASNTPGPKLFWVTKLPHKGDYKLNYVTTHLRLVRSCSFTRPSTVLLNPQAMHSEPIAEPAPKLVQRPPPPRPGRLRAEGFYEGYMLTCFCEGSILGFMRIRKPCLAGFHPVGGTFTARAIDTNHCKRVVQVTVDIDSEYPTTRTLSKYKRCCSRYYPVYQWPSSQA